MATCLIDAIEGRNVATADIPGAFLQATMDDDVWIKFENEVADVLVELDPERYKSCVYYHNGRKFLYAKVINAIYGDMKSALLFYQLFSGQLADWGFKKNNYDACTMNKTVNGSQLTIVWMLMTARSVILLRKWLLTCSPSSEKHSGKNLLSPLLEDWCTIV